MSFSDSSASEVEAEEDGEYDGTEDYEFRRKKRLKRTKEDIMLGVFGSEDEDQPAKFRPDKTLRDEAPSFAKAGDESLPEDERPFFARQPIYQSVESEDSKKIGQFEPSFRFGTFHNSEGAFIPSAHASISRLPVRETPVAPRVHASKRKNVQVGKEDTRLKSSFGARMLAKMGYKEGEGLGATGKGIVKPIQAQMRTGQKAGLGIDARSPDDSEEHKGHRSNRSRTRDPSGPLKRRTAQDIMEEAGKDFPLPKNIYDMMDLSSPVLQIETTNNPERQALTISEVRQAASNARKDIEVYAVEWKSLSDKKLYLNAERTRTTEEMGYARTNLATLRQLQVEMTKIKTVLYHATDAETTWARVLHILEVIQDNPDFMQNKLSETLAVAVLFPLLRSLIQSWKPLTQPDRFITALQRLSPILKVDTVNDPPDHRTLAPYEVMMLKVWLPKVCSTIGKDWRIEESFNMLKFLQSWSPITPLSVKSQLITQLIQPRLIDLVKNWTHKRSKTSISWLFEWLPYLSTNSAELTETLQQKFSTTIGVWQPKDKIIAELQDWSELLGAHYIQIRLQQNILPRLAEDVRRNLVISPADQDLKVIDRVLCWHPYLSIDDLAELFTKEFFPKWLAVLHAWLSYAEVDYAEVSDWYAWWSSTLPHFLIKHIAVHKKLRQGLEMMETILDHGAGSLPALPVGPEVPLDLRAHKTSQKAPPPKVDRKEEEELTFKDVVESFCTEHSLLLLPLRKSNSLGHPLFRIAGASGRTGLVGYIQGDLLMLQRDRKDKEAFHAVDVEDLPGLIV